MPTIKPPKQSLEGRSPLPPGIYFFRLDDFKPKFSKDKQSINLNPVMKVINHQDPQINDRPIFLNLNSQAGWEQKDLVHSIGVPMGGQDKDEFPGKFEPDTEPDPEKWQYVGPLKGKTGRCEIAMASNGKGGTTSKVKRFFCNIPGCQEKHAESLI